MITFPTQFSLSIDGETLRFIKIPTYAEVALLIDADNVRLNYIEQVLKISEYYGEPLIRRIYGDWTKLPLLPWREKLEALHLDLRQVNRVGKNATDNRILAEAGEILGSSPLKNNVSIFILVSGDGDYASLCEMIQDRGNQIIGIGNKKQTSPSLPKSCDKFHYLEDMDHELGKLEKLCPIPPREVRRFTNTLFMAYHQLTGEAEWVHYRRLDTKMREIDPDYDSKFGKYKLSEWLKNFEQEFENHDQMIRRIDPHEE